MKDFITRPDIYMGGNYVVLDVETATNHGDYGHAMHPDNKLVLACWRLGPEHPFQDAGDHTRYSWGGEYEQQALVAAIREADFIVAHNAKYELGWLKRCGLDLHDTIAFCTKIAEYVLCGNLAAKDDKQGLRPIDTSLSACCRRRGYLDKDPVTDKLITGGVNPAAIPRSWLGGRCVRDVEETEKLFLDQRNTLRESNRLAVAHTRNILTPVLAEIEFEGMYLDEERVEQEWEKYARELARLESEFDELTGGINWGSPKQIAHYIYDVLGFDELRDHKGNVKRNQPTARNPEGSRLTNKETLQALKAKTKEQKEFIRLKTRLSKVGNALSKNLDFFIGVCDELECLAHFEFNQTTTGTNRLSSSGVKTFFKRFQEFKTAQGQNIPRAFKRLFTARYPDWVMCEVDGASLEFRVAGIVTGDPQIRDDILGHHDPHRYSASVMNKLSEEEVTGEQRTAAKSDTFKPLYGGSSGTKAQQEYYAAFRERYKVMHQCQLSWVEAVLRDKVLRTAWGLMYYWPTASRSKGGYVNVGNSVFNYPIQGFATAEIIPIAVSYLWHLIRDGGLSDHVRLVNTIHDSVIAEVQQGWEDAYRELAIQAFTTCVYEYCMVVYGIDIGATGIPLGVGVKFGPHWSEGNEEKYNVFADGRREKYE